MLEARISAATMATFVGYDLFGSLIELVVDRILLESQSRHLLMAIVDKYVYIRVHHVPKTTAQSVHLETSIKITLSRHSLKVSSCSGWRTEL